MIYRNASAAALYFIFILCILSAPNDAGFTRLPCEYARHPAILVRAASSGDVRLLRPERPPGASISGERGRPWRPRASARGHFVASAQNGTPASARSLAADCEALPAARSWCGRNRFWVLMQRNSWHLDGPGLAPRNLRGHGKPRLRPRSASPRFLVSKVRLTEFLRGQCDEHEPEDFGSEITKYVEHLAFVGYLTRATHFIVRVALGQLPD